MTVQDSPRRDNRFLMWAGHYSIRIMAPAIAGLVLFSVTGRPGGDEGVLSWVVTAVWLAWFATVILDFNYHEARLCERCIAATPLDPQKAVTRWDRCLRLYHSKKTVSAAAITMTTWFFIGPWISDHHWWGSIIDVCTFAMIGVVYVALHVHRRLYPWCPYCHWGDGGQEEVVPDPDPAASVS